MLQVVRGPARRSYRVYGCRIAGARGGSSDLASSADAGGRRSHAGAMVRMVARAVDDLDAYLRRR
jgi:hypothetical protein